MYDKDILFMCSESRDNYTRYRRYVKDHLVEKETTVLLNELGDYYKAHPGATFSWGGFGAYVTSILQFKVTPDRMLLIRALLSGMESYTPSEAYDTVIKSLIEADHVAMIAKECEKVRDGTSDIEHVHDLATTALRELERYIDKDELFVTPDIVSVADRISSTGYEWRLNPLNRSLGLLRPGDFIIVAARVEVGKTTFLASEASYFATQMPKGRPIVWVNNEEKSDTVFFRVVQSALGLTTKEILGDTKSCMLAYDTLMGDRKRILITDGNTNHVKVLDTLFKDVNPGMIIFDQLDKVGGFSGEDREDIRLGKLYKWAREKAREYGPVIAASQLTATAEEIKDPPFIGMESLRGSKTDKPGEADAVITIGKWKTPAAGQENLRTINVPKNKLPGGGKVQVESERHGQYVVELDPLRARYQ